MQANLAALSEGRKNNINPIVQPPHNARMMLRAGSFHTKALVPHEQAAQKPDYLILILKQTALLLPLL